MFNFSLVMQRLTDGHLLEVNSILSAFLQTKALLSSEDKAQLFIIFDWMHQHSMQYSENHWHIDDPYYLIAQENDAAELVDALEDDAQDILRDDNNETQIGFMTDRLIMENIKSIFLTADFHAKQGYHVGLSPTLLDYIFAENNYHKHFLRNMIIQEWFSSYAKQRPATYFLRLLTDIEFARRYVIDLNLNIITGQFGECFLSYAMKLNVSDEIFDLLIQQGANVNGHFKLPAFMHNLHRLMATHREDPLLGRAQTSIIFEEAKIFVEYHEKSPLMEAIFKGDHRKALRLLQAPELLINTKSPFFGPNGMSQVRQPTPLMIASYLGQHEVVNTLIAKGVDIHAVDNAGESALFYALRANQKCMLQTLIESGANVAQKNSLNQTVTDLLSIFVYPYMKHSFMVVPLLQVVFLRHLDRMIDDVERMIDRANPCVIDDIPKHQLLNQLSEYFETGRQAQASLRFFAAATSAPSSLNRRMLMMYQGHAQDPKIYGQNQDADILIMAKSNGNYQLRKKTLPFDKTHALLVLANKLRFVNRLPNSLCAHIACFFSFQFISDFFLDEQHMFEFLQPFEQTYFAKANP